MGPPQIFFQPYFKATKSNGTLLQGMENTNLWLSSVIPLSKEKFIEVSRMIKGEVIARYYKGDEDIQDFPKTLEEYKKLNRKNKGSK